MKVKKKGLLGPTRSTLIVVAGQANVCDSLALGPVLQHTSFEFGAHSKIHEGKRITSGSQLTVG